MHVNSFLGRALVFGNGLSVGFNWVHSNGQTSKTSAVIAAYHPPRSITWRWALDWDRPLRLLCRPRFNRCKPAPFSEMGRIAIILPIVGGLSLRWQPYMWRNR
jgi:hypothetical protein